MLHTVIATKFARRWMMRAADHPKNAPTRSVLSSSRPSKTENFFKSVDQKSLDRDTGDHGARPSRLGPIDRRAALEAILVVRRAIEASKIHAFAGEKIGEPPHHTGTILLRVEVASLVSDEFSRITVSDEFRGLRSSLG